MKILLTISLLSIMAVSVGCNRGGSNKSDSGTSASPQEQQDDTQGHHRGSGSNSDSSTNMNP